MPQVGLCGGTGQGTAAPQGAEQGGAEPASPSVGSGPWKPHISCPQGVTDNGREHGGSQRWEGGNGAVRREPGRVKPGPESPGSVTEGESGPSDLLDLASQKYRCRWRHRADQSLALWLVSLPGLRIL